jgi:hypothetical protein
MAKFLPKTRARIPSSIEIYLTDPISGIDYLIGAITKFSLKMSRMTTRRFEIDSDYPGKSVEIIPGRINDLSLEVDKAILYNNLASLYNNNTEIPPTTTDKSNYKAAGDWMGLLKSLHISSGFDIVQQMVPFTIIEKRYDPTGNPISSNGEEKSNINKNPQIIRYEDCLISDVPVIYDINGDWLILQTLTIQVGRITEQQQ